MTILAASSAATISGCALFDEMTQIGVYAFELRNDRRHRVLSSLTGGIAVAKAGVSLDPPPRYLARGGIDVAFKVSPVEPWQTMGKRDAAASAGGQHVRLHSRFRGQQLNT
jgi:hypothetical protein